MHFEKIFHFLAVSCILLVIECSDIVFPCQTPNNERAFCVSLFKCPPLLKSLGTLDPTAIQFAQESICSSSCGVKDLMVCCGKQGNYEGVEIRSNITETSHIINPTPATVPQCQPTTQSTPQTTQTVQSSTQSTQSSTPQSSTTNPPITITTTQSVKSATTSKESHRDFVLQNLLPSRVFCGLQHTDDRIYTDSETALDEFPWLVHVLFGNDTSDPNFVDDPLEYVDRCSGVLITNRYVLTNAYCAREPAGRIRLGQYNTNKTVSCIPNSNFEECTEPVREVLVEKLILMVDDTYGWYDFALIRLAKKLQYSDFIRPICLPIDIDLQGNELTFSGFGATVQSGVVKKRVTYKSVDAELCYKENGDVRELAANSSLVCLVPKQQQNNNTVCSGDEGGALMYSHKHQWFAHAIIATVYYNRDSESVCANDRPIDGIKITPKVIEWILDTIQP